MFRQGRRFITAISAIALGVLIVLGILLPDVFWWMLLAAGLSFLMSKVLTRALRARFNERTYMDLRDHPLVQRMVSLDWESVVEGKYPQPVFTRKRLCYGVGTAVPFAAEEKSEEDGKISD